MIFYKRELGLCYFLYIVSVVATAKEADRDAPLYLKAENANFDADKKKYFLSGEVLLTKGSIVLKSHSIEAVLDQDSKAMVIAHAAEGKKIFFRQAGDQTDEWIEAESQTATFDEKKNLLHLKGQASLKRLHKKQVIESITAELIVLDNHHTFYRAQGSAKQPAYIMLLPKKNNK